MRSATQLQHLQPSKLIALTAPSNRNALAAVPPRPSGPLLRFSWNSLRGANAKPITPHSAPFAQQQQMPEQPKEQQTSGTVHHASDFDGAPDDYDGSYGSDDRSDDDVDQQCAETALACGGGSSRYGTAGYFSTSRKHDERDARESAAVNRKKRPSHSKFAEGKLRPELLASVITRSHSCRFQWQDERGE
eukprot:4269841-Pleurochrysis_carterae.AAC.1